MADAAEGLIFGEVGTARGHPAAGAGDALEIGWRGELVRCGTWLRLMTDESRVRSTRAFIERLPAGCAPLEQQQSMSIRRSNQMHDDTM
jgi:hypothetical protein